MIDTIMLFSAGRGTRMEHLTKDTPKSLIKILGKPVLHYALDMCKIFEFKKIIINTHYLPDKIITSLADYRKNNPDFPEIIVVHEEELLETGGAIKNAHKTLGDKPIFALNTDVILQTNYNIFQDMQKKWDPEKMDFLILLQPYDKAIGYTGHGDFELNPDGSISRPEINASPSSSGSTEGSRTKKHYNFMYAGLVILKPSKIAANPLKIFSLKDYYLNLEGVSGIEAKKCQMVPRHPARRYRGD
jgi:UTP-glucose-1-phosphate uridylyltransferase